MITSSIQERQRESIRHLRRATAKIIKRKIPLPPSPIFSLASLIHSRRNELTNSPLEQKNRASTQPSSSSEETKKTSPRSDREV